MITHSAGGQRPCGRALEPAAARHADDRARRPSRRTGRRWKTRMPRRTLAQDAVRPAPRTAARLDFSSRRSRRPKPPPPGVAISNLLARLDARARSSRRSVSEPPVARTDAVDARPTRLRRPRDRKARCADDWTGSPPSSPRGTRCGAPARRRRGARPRRPSRRGSRTRAAAPGTAFSSTSGSVSRELVMCVCTPLAPSKSGAGARAAGDRLVVLVAFVAEREVVHRALRRGLQAERAVQRVDDALRRLDVAGDHGSGQRPGRASSRGGTTIVSGRRQPALSGIGSSISVRNT